MSNPTLVGHYSGDTGSSSAASVSCTLTSVQAGDLVVAVVCAERSTATCGTPQTGASNSFTSDANSSDTTMAWSFSHYTLVSGDISGGSCTVTSTVSTSTRRQAIACTVLRDWDSVAFQGGTYTENATGVYTATTPSITPSDDDAELVAALAAVSNVTPYQRTWSVNSPYTMGVNDGSTSTSSTNAYAMVAYQGLTGGGSSSQSGATYNDTTPEKFAWFAGTWAVTPDTTIVETVSDTVGIHDPGTSEAISDEPDEAIGLTDEVSYLLPDHDQDISDSAGLTDRLVFDVDAGYVDSAGLTDRIVIEFSITGDLVFRPPSVLRHLLGRPRHPLFSRVSTPVSLSILKNGGSYTQVENPTDEALVAADIAYIGGHVYPVSTAEATDLDAAGYGAYLSLAEDE